MRPVIDPPRPLVVDPTRARPEPWFVGGGKGLMILVLSLCAILIVARGATMWWLYEDAREWWRERSSNLPRPAIRAAPPAPPRPSPPPDIAKADAKLKGDPGLAFPPDSYPPEAIRRGEQGRVVALLNVDAGGSTTSCVVKASSGSRSLDRATCDIVVAGVRFEPARDGRGVAIGSTYILPVRWVLPKD